MGLTAENCPYQIWGKSPTSSWNWYGPELTVELLAHHPMQLIACLMSCFCREVGPVLQLFSSSQSCEEYEVTHHHLQHPSEEHNDFSKSFPGPCSPSDLHSKYFCLFHALSIPDVFKNACLHCLLESFVKKIS